MPTLSQWLQQNGLEEYAERFVEQRIDLDVLSELTDDELRELGVPLGDRKRLLRAARGLSPHQRDTPQGTAPTPGSEAERRQLTVMFCDLVGSTALSRSLDPEEYRELLRAYQTTASEPIREYGGFVSRYLGDGLLVHFGYPQAHEDDPERAVRAGLAIVGAIGEVLAPNGQSLQVRVGIATGRVVVGDIIGEGASEERAVLGDTPNLAARLQSLAEPNQVILSEATRAQVEGRFALEEIGPFDLKGIEEPVSAFLALSVVDTSRFEARSVFGLTPLVGREEELGILTRRWRLAQESEGQIVLLSGEAGIGKSRLAEHLRSHIVSSHPVMRYQCSPFRTNSAFYPISAQLERVAGFTNEDSKDEKLEKLEALLGFSAASATSDPCQDTGSQDVALLADLLSLPTERYPPLAMSPQKEKQMILGLLIRRLEELAADSPLLVLLEDAHWIDPSSLEAFDALAREVEALPVLLLITHRPEFDHPWARMRNVTQLSLNSLGTADVTELVRELTHGRELPDDVLEEIIEKTDGIPLFVEEFTKTVLESGLVEERDGVYERSGSPAQSTLPSTLHDSLMARLDRLGPVKEIAQIASVLGREFEHGLLAGLTPLGTEELSQALDQLADAELLGRRGVPPRARYTFKHALVQDAAYASLLLATRKRLHRRAAQLMREQFQEQTEAEPDLLAHHLTEAEEMAPAIIEWTRAGDLAARRSATVEAIHHFRRGLELVEHIEDPNDRATSELSLQSRLGAVLTGTLGYTDPLTKAAYQRAYELTNQVEADVSVFLIRYGVWGGQLVAHGLKESLALGTETLALAEGHDDAIPSLLGHDMIGVTCSMIGDLEPARQHLQKALELYDPEVHRDLIFQTSEDPRYECFCFLANVEWLTGYPDRAKECTRKAVEWARELSYGPAMAYAIWHAALHDWLRGDFEAAGDLADEVIALTSEQEASAWLAQGEMVKGAILCEMQEWDQSIASIQRGRAVWGTDIYASLHLAWLASAYRGAGRIDDAHNALTEALQGVGGTEERFWEAELHRLRGVLYLDHDDRETAQKCFREALDVSRQQGARSLELRAALSLGRVLVEQGDRGRARKLVEPLYLTFTEGLDTLDLIDARTFLDELK